MVRLAIGLLVATAGTTAAAQEELPAPADAAPVPEAAPAPAPAPAAAPAPEPAKSYAPDEADVRGALGFQIMGDTRLIDGGVTAPPATVGVRTWGEDGGWEAGLSMAVFGDDGDVDYTLGFMGGLLRPLSQYKHMTVFFEPHVGFWALLPETGDNIYALNLRVSLGAEIRLGMIELPRIGVTTRISAGLDMLHEEDTDLSLLGTGGGVNSGLRGLIEGAFGFVIYI